MTILFLKKKKDAVFFYFYLFDPVLLIKSLGLIPVFHLQGSCFQQLFLMHGFKASTFSWSMILLQYSLQWEMCESTYLIIQKLIWKTLENWCLSSPRGDQHLKVCYQFWPKESQDFGEAFICIAMHYMHIYNIHW